MIDIEPLNDSLTITILDVGDGDSIIVQLPEINTFEHMVIDCKKSTTTKDWLKKLGATDLALVTATHPHYDHIAGLKSVLTEYQGKVEQFWDSGFRHNSVTWFNLAEYITEVDTNIQFIRPTSGLYTTFNDVNVTVLAPSIALRNRYDSYGVNINNASIVLKLEYGGKSVILAGDAQWDSWGKMTEEFPQYVKTENPDQHVQIDVSHKPLKCNVLKVAHHGSKHGTALEPVEVLKPNYAIIPCADPSSYGFPHEITMKSLEEIGTKVIETGKCGNILIEIESDGSLNVYQNVTAISKNKYQGVKC
ncbi:MAG: MBL fold metallo-hydrolase [Asgard group archaeon]|nr:MBL fold metallo-hydrolase [Asgard group archaeon]